MSTSNGKSAPGGGKSRRQLLAAQFIAEDGANNTPDELHFMMALDRYKREGHAHPDWDEVLDVLRAMGYRKSAAVDSRAFKIAVLRYQRQRNRQFPTSSEILQVAKRIGYAKDAPSASWSMAAEAQRSADVLAQAADEAKECHRAAVETERALAEALAVARKQKAIAANALLKAMELAQLARRTAEAHKAVVAPV